MRAPTPDEAGEATPTLLPVGAWLLAIAVTVWGAAANAHRRARRYERQLAADFRRTL